LETSGVSLWLAFQADYEAQRLLHALDHYALGGPEVSHSDLLDRLDIFWSRLPLLIRGEDSAIITRVTDAETLVPEILSKLERAELTLQSLTPENREAYAAARKQLAEFQEPLHQLSLKVDHALGQYQFLLQSHMSNLYSSHIIYLIGILGSSAVFIFLLFVESSRTRRLLAVALEARAHVAHLAHHDALTGLPNRVLFQDRLQQAVARAGRDGGRIAVHWLDLDGFKEVNDRYGHDIGDSVLVSVAQRMLSCLRRSDTLARLGGDEFAVVQVGLDDTRGAAQLAERVLHTFEEPLALNGRQLRVSASLGVALFPDDGEETAQLLRNADTALYKAKADGRDTVRFYSSEMGRQTQARHRVEQDLREAMEHGGLELYYQPKYAVAGRRIVGMEALLRWNRPGNGLLRPDEFVPIAEDCGLIAPIGDWVLRSACMQNRAWQEAGFPALRVGVNLSAVQFASNNLVSEIHKILRESRLKAQYLELEITESVLLYDVDRTLDIIKELRRSGIRLSLDDFGTGYSSLNYLLSFNFDSLKIDRRFIRDLGMGGAGEPVCRALFALARNLNMSVVAEGVETADQLAWLEAMGCDEVQGYYLGAPEPAQSFERRLTALTAA
jgi:diguanylate cyclase (GGDEF)-like protein